MADFIPGINVGALVRRVTGKTNGVDEDIISGLSKKGGTRTTGGGTFGRTAVANAAPVKPAPAPLQAFPTLDTIGTSSARGGGGGGLSGGAAVDEDAPLRAALKNEIRSRGGDIDSVYANLFGDLDALLRTRDAELEGQYGDQFAQAAKTYTAALPEIENSYAAIGSADSTDQTDAKIKAKSGYEETTKTIGKNKEADKAKLGAYGNEQRAKFNADRDSAKRNIGRVEETTDVDALRGLRGDLESNIGQAGVTRATLGTEGAACRDLTNLTQDSGRFDAAVNSLDSIIKSSMSGSVKEAAVKAITDNAGLSEDEKQKINAQYGNVYAEQAAL